MARVRSVTAPMGVQKGKEYSKEQMKRTTDRVYEYFAPSGSLSFPDIYTAVLVVYNDLNKMPGAHFEPPTKQEVHKIFRKLDKNRDNELSREEFALFMERFTSKAFQKAGKPFLIFCIVAPALAFLAKHGIEGLPYIGEYAHKIPTPIYASIVTALVILLQQR